MSDTRWDTSHKLSEVLSEYMRDNGTNTAMLERRAASLWNYIMGPTITKNTNSVRVKDGIMYVRLNSSMVRAELFNMKARILAEINKQVGQEAVKDIRFM